MGQVCPNFRTYHFRPLHHHALQNYSPPLARTWLWAKPPQELSVLVCHLHGTMGDRNLDFRWWGKGGLISCCLKESFVNPVTSSYVIALTNWINFSLQRALFCNRVCLGFFFGAWTSSTQIQRSASFLDILHHFRELRGPLELSKVIISSSFLLSYQWKEQSYPHQPLILSHSQHPHDHATFCHASY